MKGPTIPPEEKQESKLPPETAPANPSPAEDARGSTWIAEVSHELRLPIANIRLLIETLLDGALEDADVSRRMLKRAYQEVDRLQALVRDLLSVEEVAESRQDLKYSWNDLQAAARYAAESVASLAQSRGVEILIEVPKRRQIYANTDQLNQVLLNLVENAVKFTAEGGKVTVRSGAEPGTFSVIDTGIGMPEHEIPKIFQRFYRIDRTQAKGSTGLGLSIVKNIMELHGGKITVESQEGKGSAFHLEFPEPR